EYGIFHFWQLAAMSEADVAALDAELKLNGRAARDGWLDTARALAA
ncbi:MAG: 30S ribosomal protein S2, partial [Methylobacterium sp.]|nr:30S ribosomal protein S2 [Methylobacterium sp.]